MLGHITGDVPTSLLMRTLCSFTTLEEIWEGARKRVGQVKATKPGKCSHVTLEVALAEHRHAVWCSCEQMQQPSMLQCHDSIRPVAFKWFLAA